MHARKETVQRVEQSRRALQDFFRAEEWSFPFRLVLLLIAAGLTLYLDLGAWSWFWIGTTILLELLGYRWRRRSRHVRWSGRRLRRIFLTNEIIGHAILIAWTGGAIGLYHSGIEPGRLAAMLMLGAIGMTVARQPGRLTYAMWLNAAIPSAALVTLTAFDLGTLTGFIRFAAAFLFAANIVSVAFMALRERNAVLQAQLSQERLIDELEEARDAALAGRREAEEVARHKAEFLAVMSHEVRTPLNGILTMAEVLGRSSLDDEQKRQVAAIAESGRMLLGIVSDILDLSRAEAGHDAPVARPVRLASLLDEGLALWRLRAREQGLSFDTAIAPDVPDTILADETRLRQILFNLLANALKFTDRGGIAVRVERFADGDNAHLRFAVSDTGIGIHRQDLERIFERFEQAETGPARRHQGTGLGLAIVRDLVRLMGGRIGVDSREGEGSTFWFTMPLIPAREADANEPDLRDALPAPPRTGRPRILVADDNRINRTVFEALLAPLDVEIIEVEDGAEAIRAAADETPDLVLMDIRMPGTDGLTAIREIRRRRETAVLPVIALSASGRPEDEAACLAAGADAYLAKPIDSAALYRLLERFLGQHKACMTSQKNGTRQA
ncbi:MAG: response regulator [Alphaproteobacteria bacterium]|nr:MAG: response regulator [Alphaproteobacteria bacterium]